MATLSFTDAALVVADIDLTSTVNQISIDASADEMDITTFADAGSRKRLQTLKDWSASGSGYVHLGVGLNDENLFTAVDTGDSEQPLIVVPVMGGTSTPAVGDVAYFGEMIRSKYEPGGERGSVLPFSFSASGSGGQRGLTRGEILINKTALTTTGSGTARQLGDVAAGERIRACISVLAVSGTSPTLDLVLESDDGVGMASATTRATFAQLTTTGSAWVESTTVTADDWWRISYTLGGTTPSFTVLLAVGIGTD